MFRVVYRIDEAFSLWKEHRFLNGVADTHSIANMNPERFTNPQQEIVIHEATYKGRGSYQVRVKNKGNIGIGAKPLELRPFYFVQNRPVLVGATTTNRSPIPANSTKQISSDGGGIYAFGMPECSKLEKLVIEIKHPGTGKVVEHTIPISRPTGRRTYGAD